MTTEELQAYYIEYQTRIAAGIEGAYDHCAACGAPRPSGDEELCLACLAEYRIMVGENVACVEGGTWEYCAACAKHVPDANPESDTDTLCAPCAEFYRRMVRGASTD